MRSIKKAIGKGTGRLRKASVGAAAAVKSRVARVRSLPRRGKLQSSKRLSLKAGNTRAARAFRKVATLGGRFQSAALGYRAPHGGRSVRDVVAGRKLRREFVRVYTGGAKGSAGSFLVRRSAVAGLSARQIQAKLQLRSRPTRIQSVVIPRGTRLRAGRIAKQPIAPKGRSRVYQYELLHSIPPRNFRTGKRL
ncbi:MAG: hypothetical protein AAGG01_22705 [Planctomycetota bacterium]